jgi:glycosidase
MRRDIIYQIFPDRFSRGNIEENPKGTGLWGSNVDKNCFMGGDLDGIINKLDYISDLGFTAIYLNPIFLSTSNHKYDVSDYYKIDTNFGSLETFKKLLDASHKKGIKIIIDGVFNHTGTDFFAFKDILQYQRQSKYINWYEIFEYPVEIRENPPYKACGGVSFLPKLNTSNPEVQEYIINVIKYWEGFGIDGIRLDVPFEIHPSLLKKIRNETELFLIGEIWGYDADNIPKYFNSITNYVLRDLIRKAVVNQCITSKMFFYEWSLIENSYKNNIYNLINLAGSHDTKRIYNLCDGNMKKEKIFYLMLFMLPGTPLIYYGDEIGLQGENDPYCRGCMDWNEENWNYEIYNHIKALIKMRNTYEVLTNGKLKLLYPSDRTLVIERYDDSYKISCYINFGFQSDKIDGIHVEPMNYSFKID